MNFESLPKGKKKFNKNNEMQSKVIYLSLLQLPLQSHLIHSPKSG